MIGIPDRKFAEQQPSGAHRGVVGNDHDGAAPALQDASCFREQAPRLARVLEDGDQQDDLERFIGERQLVPVGAQEEAALAGRAPHTRHRNVHLYRLQAGAVEHHPLAAADFEDVAATDTGDTRHHLVAVHPVEVADNAGHLRVVAFDFGRVLVEIAFAKLSRVGGRTHEACGSLRRTESTARSRIDRASWRRRCGTRCIRVRRLRA